MVCPVVPANESAWDRGLRILLGLVLLALTVGGPRTAWGLVGLVPLATGVAGRCPLYALTGLSTRRPGAGPPAGA